MRTISELSELPLWRPLASEGDAKDAARVIARTPALLAEAREVNESLQRLAKPIGKGQAAAEAVFRAMAPLLVAYGRPKKTDAELTTWWGLYFDALSGLPLPAIEEAVSVYIRDSEFAVIPPPGKLVKLAQPVAAQLWRAAYRVRLALETPPPKREVSAEDRAVVKAGLEDLKRTLAVRRDAEPAGPRLTPHEMAEALRR